MEDKLLDNLVLEPYDETTKLADAAMEELNNLNLGYVTHTIIGMALSKLKAYESTCLIPEQIREIDKEFSVQAKELMQYRNTYCWHKIADKDFPEIGEEVYCTDGKCCFLAKIDEIGVFIDTFGDPISVTKWRRLPDWLREER